VSAPHCLHLLPADTGLTEGHQYGTYIGLCGMVLDVSSLPPSLCPDECDCEVAYCSECLREATERNAEAGLAYHTPGTRLMLAPSQLQDHQQQLNELWMSEPAGDGDHD
jgi:hypothetical protein